MAQVFWLGTLMMVKKPFWSRKKCSRGIFRLVIALFIVIYLLECNQQQVIFRSKKTQVLWQVLQLVILAVLIMLVLFILPQWYCSHYCRCVIGAFSHFHQVLFVIRICYKFNSQNQVFFVLLSSCSWYLLVPFKLATIDLRI